MRDKLRGAADPFQKQVVYMKDKLGRKLEADDVIVYSTSSRSSDNFKFGIVLEVFEREIRIIPLIGNCDKGLRQGKISKISYPERILKIDQKTFTIVNHILAIS